MHLSDHAEVFYARIPHRRWDTGVRKRPPLIQFEPSNFLRLHQTAHAESTVDKLDNFAFKPVAAGKFKTNMNEARAA